MSAAVVTDRHPDAIVQPALWSVQEPVALELDVKRVELGDEAWVDTMTGFVQGGDTLLDTLVAMVPLVAQRRPMYDNMVDVPRLSGHLPTDLLGSVQPIVQDIASKLGIRYRKAFTWVGINLYRNERDSVAWHADKIGRVMREPIVGLVSLGVR